VGAALGPPHWPATVAAAAPALSLQRFFDTRAVSKSPIDSAVLSLLDYNTVEATMIASAILVCLSGLMFTSSRFTGALEGYYQCAVGPGTGPEDPLPLRASRTSTTGLAYVTVAVVVLTLVYYGFNFIVDCLLDLEVRRGPTLPHPSTPVTPTPLRGRPETAVSLFVCGRGVERARQALIAARKGGSASNPNRAKRQASTLAKAAGGGDDGRGGGQHQHGSEPCHASAGSIDDGCAEARRVGPNAVPPPFLCSATQRRTRSPQSSRSQTWSRRPMTCSGPRSAATWLPWRLQSRA